MCLDYLYLSNYSNVYLYVRERIYDVIDKVDIVKRVNVLFKNICIKMKYMRYPIILGYNVK